MTSITLSGILIYLSVLTFGLLYFLKQKKEIVLHLFTQVNLAFIIYIFVFALSKFINSGFQEGFHSFCRICQDYFVFLWVLFFLNTEKSENNKNILKYSILFAGFLSIVYGLFQYFHFDIFHRQINIHRLSGFHKNTYTYGGQLIIFFFLFLDQLIHEEKKSIAKKIFFLVMLSSCLFCIFNTLERAVILGVLVGLVIYLVFANVNRKILFSSLSVIFFMIFLIVNFNKKLYNRIKNTISPRKGVKPNVRFKLWGIAISVWKRNVLFGVKKFPEVAYQASSNAPIQILTHAHNVYLQVLVTHGILGFLAFINLFISILKTLFSNLQSKYTICLIAVIFSFLVEGFFEYFWGDSEVRYLLLYFVGFVFGHLKSVNNTVNS